MPRATEPLPLTKTEARLLWLQAQRLDTGEPFGAGPQAVAAAVDHLGYVQIDTIHVIERCHHHILYSRIPAYARADLRQAQSVDKSVFEYWTHALSYVPAKDFRFFVPAMRLHKREGHQWFASVKPEDTRKVMRLLRRDGALTIRDIEDDVLVEKEHPWASRKPSTRSTCEPQGASRPWAKRARWGPGSATTSSIRRALRDRGVHRLLDLGGTRCRRRVLLEHGNFGGFLVHEVGPPPALELFDRIAALFDQGRQDLLRLRLVERAPL